MPYSCEHRIAKTSTSARILTFRWMVALSVPLLLISMLWITMHNSASIAHAAGNEAYVGPCTALTPHFDTIQEAVKNADSDTVINICPGVYTDSVNLSLMKTMGDITLRRIPGVTDPVLISPTVGSGIKITDVNTFIGNITIESINVSADSGKGIDFGESRNVQGSVIISDVNALDNSESGAIIRALGNVLVENSSFNNNGYYGLFLSADGNIDVINTRANANGSHLSIGYENTGIWIETEGYYAVCGIEAADAEPRINIESVEASENYGWGVNIQGKRSVYISNTVVISNAYDGLVADTYYACGSSALGIHLSNSTAISNGWYIETGPSNEVEVQIPLPDPYGGFRLVSEGNISVSSDTVAEQNGFFGFCLDSDAETLVNGAQAVSNYGDGFLYGYECMYYGAKGLGEAETFDSEIDIAGAYIPPSLVFSNTSAISNMGTGFAIADTSTAITLVNVSALDNINGVSFASPEPVGPGTVGSDFNVEYAPPVVPTVIQDSLIQGNDDYGVLYGQSVYAPTGIQAISAVTSTNFVSSSILCENGVGLSAMQYAGVDSVGIEYVPSDFALYVDARGNWWGSATGPTTPANPGGTGDSIETGLFNPAVAANTVDVLFDPWINTLHANAAPSPTIIGVPVALEYQFSDGSLSYFLENGVGDPNNGPIFNLSATNGAVDSTDKFIVGTSIHGTATPAAPGIMAVTLDGPCGLDSTLNVPVATPAIEITKSPDLQGVTAGDTAIFTVTIANSGNITLTNITVSDSVAPNCSRATGALGDLGIGASETYSCSLVVNNDLVNSITAQGFALVGGVAAGTPVSDDDTAEALLASLVLTKTVFVDGYRELINGNTFNPSECAVNSIITVPVSSTVKYCYTITNTGSYTVSTHTLVDNHFPDPILSNFPWEVGPGESFSTVEAGIEVTKTLVTGFTNVATWSATIAPPVNEISTRALDAWIPVAPTTAATVNISTPDLDQDGDGIPDNIEGTGDVDVDGIPDYLDPTTPTGLDETDQPDADESIFLPSVVR